MYTSMYNDDCIRGNHTDFLCYISPFLSKTSEIVDLGCGTCRKVIQFAPLVRSVSAIDRNPSMLSIARKTLKSEQIGNVQLFQGDNCNTPFLSHTFDICTTSLSTWSAAEAHRILKPNGLFLIETLSPDDKHQIKQAFGTDAIGPRGYLCNQTVEERLFYLRSSLCPFFNILDIKLAERETTLSKTGFVNLLKTTPTIRDFSEKKEEAIIDRLLKDGNIRFIEKRIMICAKAKTTEALV